MMEVSLLAVGKLKEAYLRDGCAEYIKRLGAYCVPRVAEQPEFRLAASPSPAEIANALSREGKALLGKIPAGSAVAALCVEGEMLTSVQLAALLEGIAGGGRSRAVFIIGGSHGLSQEVKAAAEYRLSLSRMTFPHQLARLMLLEQLYRAFSISGHGKYHK